MKHLFAQYVDELREKQNISKFMLARKAGINRTTLIYMFNGKHAPSIENAYEVLKALETNFTEFETWLKGKE